MPSAEKNASSLAGRVAVGTAFAAAVASLVAALATLFVTDRLMLDQEDRRMHGMGTIAIHEIPDADEKIAAAIVDEQEELAPESVRIAYRRVNGAFLGGDESLPDLASGACESRNALQATVRMCALADGKYRVVVATTRASRSPYWIVLPCAIAIAIASIAAAVAGRRSARWALAPLFRLRDSLDTISDDPRAAKLSDDEACNEVTTLRTTIERLLGRLADALEGARSFSSDAAHELKTPLTALRAELDLLAEEELNPAASEAVERLRVRTAVLGRLVDRLLALTRVSGHGRLELETLAVEDIVSDILQRMSEAQRARVRVEADVPGMVNGDELLLTALLENAIENALKFSGAEPVDVRIEEREGKVVVDVTDRGPGLPEHERRRAFEPFFRSASSRATTPGHGVGLAIVAQVVTAHGGTAAFVEPPARGARLRLTLPGWSA